MEVTKEKVKVVCTDEQWAKISATTFATAMGFERVEEVANGAAYLDAMEELRASHELDTRMCALYLENTFLVSQYNNLVNISNVLTKKLQAQPLDVSITVALKKVTNDIEILEVPMRAVNAIIFKHIQDKFARDGRVFLSPYCITLNETK